MPKISAPLTDAFIKNLKATSKPQKYYDGGGLYLYVTPTGGKFWYMAYRFDGKQKTLSLGAYGIVSLGDKAKQICRRTSCYFQYKNSRKQRCILCFNLQ